MIERTDAELSRVSPAQLVDGVLSGRIRNPRARRPSSATIARVLDAIVRRFPQRPVVLWRDADGGSDEPAWLIAGAELVSVLVAVLGGEERHGDEEPVYLDAETGEIVAWRQRPDRAHPVIDVVQVLTDEPESVVAHEGLAGPAADRVRSVAAVRSELSLIMQTVVRSRAELPLLIEHVNRAAFMDGASLAQIAAAVEPRLGRPAHQWDSTPGGLVRAVGDRTLSVEHTWWALQIAEGRRPVESSMPATLPADFADGGVPAVAAVRNARHFLRTVGQMPVGRLLPDIESLQAFARFDRLFTIDRTVFDLLRRWLWRTELGGNGPDTRLVEGFHGDAAAAALRLLEATEVPVLVPPGRDPVDLDSRRGRLVLAGAAGLHPRDVATGVLVDVEVVEPRAIIRDRPAELANLLFTGSTLARSVRDALETASGDEVLRSHGVDDSMVEMLRAGDDDGFLARRAAALDEAVVRFWTAMVEPAAVVRRPVASLFEDERAG